MPRPQAFVSEFAPRLRSHFNSLLTPVVTPTTQEAGATSRKTKRGTTIFSYAEDLLANEDFDDSDGPRRPTGSRNRREESAPHREDLVEKLTTELTGPVIVQGIWRDWMGKPRIGRTDKQLQAQAVMPTALVPVRVDLEIPSFTPAPALPLPADAPAFNVNPALPAYKTPEPTPAYRLKDIFLWDLHETLATPDQFALQLVNELDLPNAAAYIAEISKQVRDQLQEYAGIALHPLFLTTSSNDAQKPVLLAPETVTSRGRTPPTPGTPLAIVGELVSTPGPADLSASTQGIEANATMAISAPDVDNPDDAYRCIVNLNINILNKLYTDKFEWSLLHPPGFAETFARQTCADIGLAGEWVPATAHAIYESVLRLRKEVCESGGLGAEILNDSIEGQEAGWRYEPDGLAEEWEPKVEALSKDEIERREGDRERQLRRARRETARFSTTTNIPGAGPTGYFDQPDTTEIPLGRGERTRKKRRFRSLSPAARGNTPAEAAGYGGGGGQATDHEKQHWRCSNCYISGSTVWMIRDGPTGARTLCNGCGLFYDRRKQLPAWSKYLHANQR